MNTTTLAKYTEPNLQVSAPWNIMQADSGDVAPLFATLTSAFVSDPPGRWIYPTAESYLKYYPSFARAFGGGALESGTAWCSSDFSACALWFAPDDGPEEKPLLEVIKTTVPVRRHEEVFAAFEALGEAHPSQRHWYLPLIGVDPAKQGLGLGGALLRFVLDRCDREGMPAYLESSSPRNVTLYERHGFGRRSEIRVGSCPPIVPMWREPNAVNDQATTNQSR